MRFAAKQNETNWKLVVGHPLKAWQKSRKPFGDISTHRKKRKVGIGDLIYLILTLATFKRCWLAFLLKREEHKMGFYVLFMTTMRREDPCIYLSFIEYRKSSLHRRSSPSALPLEHTYHTLRHFSLSFFLFKAHKVSWQNPYQ